MRREGIVLGVIFIWSVSSVQGSGYGSILCTLRDTVIGEGARNVTAEFFQLTKDDEWKPIGRDVTGGTFGAASVRYGGGSTANTEDEETRNIFRVVLHTEPYYKSKDLDTFYPYIEVIVTGQGQGGYMLVPVLMSPYGYSAYLGH